MLHNYVKVSLKFQRKYVNSHENQNEFGENTE